MDLNVTIQGISGCFHDAAAREFFSIHAPHINVQPVDCDTFPDMFSRLAADHQLVGIMAIENTIAGALLQNHELLRESNLRIIGEHKKRISHSIATLPGETLADAEAVISHPMALMQCETFLRNYPQIRSIEWFDTAGAARDIARDNLTHRAAICPRLAAELYGLDIQADAIETNKRNFTRFLVLAHEERIPSLLLPRQRINKASIVFSLPHSQGALSKILTILSFYDMNLTKIQSMPILGREWEYRFYVDLTFGSAERYHQAITAIRPLLGEFKSLGEYEECTQEI
ncbi:MAG: prephenate dehydratase [Muribaculaceae bacterium]|nr:prephenate dehydratase [Muribaculaceae bacterium]MDE6558487.1 prephenate dehydratase [Muribaculaceae bacterium]